MCHMQVVSPTSYIHIPGYLCRHPGLHTLHGISYIHIPGCRCRHPRLHTLHDKYTAEFTYTPPANTNVYKWWLLSASKSGAIYTQHSHSCATRPAKTDNFVAYIRIGNTTARGRQHALYAYKIRRRKCSSCMISKTVQPLSLALHHWKDMLIHSLPASLPLRQGVQTKQVTNKMYAEMHTYNKHINLWKYPQHCAMKMNVQHHSKIHWCTPKLLGVLCWPLPP